MPETPSELLAVRPHHCGVCGRRLELPFATARFAYAGVSSEDDSPYGEITVMAAGHLVDVFDFEEAHALEFFKSLRWFALRVQRLENLPPYDIHLEAGEGHLAARLTPSSPVVKEGSREDFHSRLLKIFSTETLVSLPESLLTRTVLSLERELVDTKFVFLNRADGPLKESLRNYLGRLKLEEWPRILEKLKIIEGTIFGEVDAATKDHYNLRWTPVLKPQRPRAIRKVFRKLRPNENIEMFYRQELIPRVVAPKWSDDQGFLAYTPSGWRRFLWARVRAVARPSVSFVTQEAIRLDRYSDGSIEVTVEDYRGDRLYGARL